MLDNQIIDFSVPAWTITEQKLLATIEADRNKLEALTDAQAEERTLTRGRIRAYRDLIRWKEAIEKEQQKR